MRDYISESSKKMTLYTKQVFAFEFKKRYQDSGWDVYDFTREYTRMGALKDKRCVFFLSFIS